MIHFPRQVWLDTSKQWKLTTIFNSCHEHFQHFCSQHSFLMHCLTQHRCISHWSWPQLTGSKIHIFYYPCTYQIVSHLMEQPAVQWVYHCHLQHQISGEQDPERQPGNIEIILYVLINSITKFSIMIGSLLTSAHWTVNTWISTQGAYFKCRRWQGMRWGGGAYLIFPKSWPGIIFFIRHLHMNKFQSWHD